MPDEIIIPRTEEFVERLATAAVSVLVQEGLFMIDFLKPDSSIISTKEGRITGYRGEMKADVRIILPPSTYKRLAEVMNGLVATYEEQYGPIKKLPVGEQP